MKNIYIKILLDNVILGSQHGGWKLHWRRSNLHIRHGLFNDFILAVIFVKFVSYRIFYFGSLLVFLNYVPVIKDLYFNLQSGGSFCD